MGPVRGALVGYVLAWAGTLAASLLAAFILLSLRARGWRSGGSSGTLVTETRTLGERLSSGRRRDPFGQTG